MPYLNLDAMLSVISGAGRRVDICSQEPATYAEATGTYSLGNKTGVTVGAPADLVNEGDTIGRKVVVEAVAGGAVTVTPAEEAAFWALTNPANSELLAAGEIVAGQAVVTPNTFTLTAIEIGIPAPPA